MRIEGLLLNKKYRKVGLQITDDYKVWQYQEIYNCVWNIKYSLLQKGIKSLDRIAIISDNCGYFVFGIIGALGAGATVVPISNDFTLNSVNAIIEDINPKCILFHGAKAKNLLNENSLFFSQVPTIDLSAVDENEIYPVKESLTKGKSSDPAFILYSSGTTGNPKGIILSHKAVLKNINAITNYMQPSGDDIFYIVKSMTHSSTLIGEVLVTLTAGSKLIIMNPYVSPNTTLKKIESYKPTILCLNPTILRLLTMRETRKYDLSSIKLIYSSGALMPKNTYDDAREKFRNAKILNVYGLTEAGPRVAAQENFRAKENYVSVGKPIKNVWVEIRDDSEKVCEALTIGRVYVKSPSLMTGYLVKSNVIKKGIKKGWLNTGDLGFVDENGELYIVGRNDDIIISGAHNINPNEIEEFVGSIAGVKDCIVFGVPDRIYGSRLICAYSAHALLQSGNDELNLEIVRRCKEYLANFQCPNNFLEWKEIPCNSSGKKMRMIAQKYYLEAIKEDNK